MSVMPTSRSTTATATASEVPILRRNASRSLRLAAFFTMAVTGPYAILLLAAIILSAILTGNVFFPDLATSAGLEYAGRFPAAVTVGYLADGLSHVLLFVSFMAIVAVLRPRWPTWSQLILVGAIVQLLAGVTKAFVSIHTVISVGAAYLAADAAGKVALLPLGGVVAGLRQGLQDMDTYGVMAVWVLIALLPTETGMPRWVRWLGVGMAAAFLLHFGPIGFIIASLLLPVWAFLLGRWLKSEHAPQ